jgi:hypothetical protein
VKGSVFKALALAVVAVIIGISAPIASAQELDPTPSSADAPVNCPARHSMATRLCMK